MTPPAVMVPVSHTASTRRVVGAALVLVVLGALGAVQAAVAGASFMFDLEQTQPPLGKIAPVTDDPHTPRLARHVYLAIVDGLRLDRSYELPFLDELRRRGIDAEASSHYPTWSRPNYVSILTGVSPSASGVRTNHHNTPVTLDTLMDRARAAGLRVASATDYDVLPRLFLRPNANANPTANTNGSIPSDEPDAIIDIDAMKDPLSSAAVHAPDANLTSPFDDARYAPWPGGFSEAGAAIVATDADLVVLLVGAVDAAGHAEGGDSPAYRAAAEQADRALARVLAKVDLSQDAIVVVADHGHTGKGGHGGVEPEVLSVPLVMAGAGVKPGATIDDAHLVDVAPTVAALLGIAAPGHGIGRTLVDALAFDGGDVSGAGSASRTPPDARSARTRRLAADDARLAVTRGAVAHAEARAADDVLEHRAERLAMVAGGFVLATLLAFGLVRRRVLRFDARVLLVSIPAFFVVYYALIGTFGQGFSPSLLPAEGNLAGALVKYGIVGMVVQLLASLWALRHHGSLADRLAAANGIAWTGLTLTMVTAGLIWAVFPPPYVTVPGPLWLVLIPAVEVAVACAAVNVALTLGFEVIVFAARAWHR